MDMQIDTGVKTFRSDAFAGRVIGITGSGHGIGEATAKTLALLGAAVVINDVDAARVARVAADLQREDLPHAAIDGDIAERATVDRMIDAAMERWGRVDGWVNNAGINLRSPVETQAEEDFSRVWEVNLLAGWRACQRLAGVMKERGGAIVNISSIMAHQCAGGTAAYAASKMALEGLTRSLAVELADRAIRVNAIMVGHIALGRAPHEYHEPADEAGRLARRARELSLLAEAPLRRIGTPEDIANTVAFLLSDAAAFITGGTIPVDGGMSIDFRAITDQRRGEAYVEMTRLRAEIGRLRSGKSSGG